MVGTSDLLRWAPLAVGVVGIGAVALCFSGNCCSSSKLKSKTPAHVTIHSYKDNLGAKKSLIAAKFGGVTIEIPESFKFGVDNKTPEYLKRFPMGEVPSADTSDGPLFESNAIARYVARKGNDEGLLGSSDIETSQVDQWIEWARSVEARQSGWVYSIVGYYPYVEAAWNMSKEGAKKYLNALNSHLQGKEYLVGNRITLADIIVVVTLERAFKVAYDPEFRRPYDNVIRWFDHCTSQPNFKPFFSDFKYCDQEGKPKAPQQ